MNITPNDPVTINASSYEKVDDPRVHAMLVMLEARNNVFDTIESQMTNRLDQINELQVMREALELSVHYAKDARATAIEKHNLELEQIRQQELTIEPEDASTIHEGLTNAQNTLFPDDSDSSKDSPEAKELQAIRDDYKPGKRWTMKISKLETSIHFVDTACQELGGNLSTLVSDAKVFLENSNDVIAELRKELSETNLDPAILKTVFVKPEDFIEHNRDLREKDADE